MANVSGQEPVPQGKHRLFFQASLTLITVLFMANLGAIIDFILHPEIE